MGPDKYEVTALVAGMHGGAARAQTLALEEAKKYCASMNKEIFVAKAWQPDEYVESSEVTFHCLDKDD
jgi:ATP-dependent protease HslVU (ClpYQ) peptidase subunit